MIVEDETSILILAKSNNFMNPIIDYKFARNVQPDFYSDREEILFV